MKPTFITRSGRDYGTSKLVGKDRDHLRLEVIEDESGSIIQGIGFNMGDHYEMVKSGKAFDVCYTIEENVFNNKTTIQIMVKDIRLSEDDEYGGF